MVSLPVGIVPPGFGVGASRVEESAVELLSSGYRALAYWLYAFDPPVGSRIEISILAREDRGEKQVPFDRS